MPHAAPDTLAKNAIPPFVGRVFAHEHLFRKTDSTAFQGPNRPLQNRLLHNVQMCFTLTNQPASVSGDHPDAVGDEVHDCLQFARQGFVKEGDDRLKNLAEV